MSRRKRVLIFPNGIVKRDRRESEGNHITAKAPEPIGEETQLRCLEATIGGPGRGVDFYMGFSIVVAIWMIGFCLFFIYRLMTANFPIE